MVSYNNLAAFNGNGGVLTGQIVLFETSNAIELHLTTQSNTTYSKVQGLENATGSAGVATPGHNLTNWTAANESWRFTSNVTTYTWSPAAGLNTTTGAVVTATPATTTTYTVTVSNGTCSNSTTQTVTITPLPVAVGNDASRCGPGTVTLTASGAPAGGSYAWYTVATGGTPIAGATTASYTTPSLSATTTYYVSALSAPGTGGCEGPRDAATATINPVPTAPIITASGPTTFCPGGSVTLTASQVQSIAYAPVAPTAVTNGPSGDDVTAAAALPFAFTYYGTSYTSVNISTNGNIQFGSNDPAYIAAPIPTAGGPENYIALSWNDWQPAAGQITYFTSGTAPNRRFVVSYNNVPAYGGSGGVLTGQIVLFETSNAIELHLTTQNNTTYNKVQGLENATGSAGVATPGHNLTNWTAANQSWRFTPETYMSTLTWSPAAGLNTTTGSSVVASPTGTTTYTVTATSPLGCQATSTQTVTIATESLWTGNTSTDWYDATNWVGCVPTLTIDARIPAGRPFYPSITAASTATVRTLTIESGGALTMNTATLRVAGNFLNQNAAAMTLTGMLQLEGTNPSFTNVGAVSSLNVNLAGGTVALPRALTVNTALTMTNGLLNTGSFAVTMAPTATLTESETTYVLGTVATTRPLVPGSANAFGGLGLTLTPAAGSTAPGSTVITRVTGTVLTGVGTSQSVRRYFNIQPAVNAGLNVNMLFGYWDHELNSIPEANLRLFRSVSGTSGPWQSYGQQGLNPGGNTVARNNIAAFSIWTLGNGVNPLPVELLAFTAERQGADAQLNWSTASELNSDRFEVESSVDGNRFALIGTRTAQGTSSGLTAY